MSSQHRIAVVINDVNAGGGVRDIALDLVRGLRRGHRTILLSIEPLGSTDFATPDLDLHTLEHRRTAHSRFARLREVLTVGRKLGRFVSSNDIDTVVAFGHDWASAAALALPRSIKTIAYEHAPYQNVSATWRWIRAKCYPRLDAVVSRTAQDLPLYRQISRMALSIPEGVEVDTRASASEGRQKILLTIAPLDVRSGIDRLLWSLKQPLLDHPDWKLVVLGDGETADWGYMTNVFHLYELLRLENQIEFYPAVAPMDDWYRRASICVTAARVEELRIVLLNAKAHALPIIAFDGSPWSAEFIRTGVDGFVIGNDGQEFADAATMLMSDVGLRCRMGNAGQEDAQKRFSRDGIISQWRELVERLHEDAGIPASGPN